MILKVYFFMGLQVLRKMRGLKTPREKQTHANNVKQREGPTTALKTSKEKSFRFIT